MKRLETEHGISALTRVFGVSRSAYADWKKREPSAREQANGKLDGQIREVFGEHRSRYGSPRVSRVLQARQVICGENRVARRMKVLGLAARKKRGFVPRTTDSRHGGPIAANLLLESAPPAGIDQVWRGDMTYIATGEGWLYLAAVLDGYSRRLLGWATDERMGSALVCEALEGARRQRGEVRGVIVHTDLGSQYASADYRSVLKTLGATASMSRKANCYDNAAMESFWSTLKTELFGDNLPATRTQARTMIFEYIEIFYNRRRLHSSLGFTSPVDFENNLN